MPMFRVAFASWLFVAAAGAALAQAPVPSPPAASTKPMASPAQPMKPAATPPGPSKAAATQAAGPAKFPSGIAPKYAKETPGKARMHTCLDQYHANKATGGNGGAMWIQKGGGYYSACLKKLKA